MAIVPISVTFTPSFVVSTDMATGYEGANGRIFKSYEEAIISKAEDKLMKDYNSCFTCSDSPMFDEVLRAFANYPVLFEAMVALAKYKQAAIVKKVES